MVRLTDIAKAVSLDVSVVSRALNPQPDRHAVIKEETRQLILDTARKLGYRPNRQASFLKKGSAATILCFLPDVADRLIADLIMGISETACHENFPVNFFFGHNPNDFGQFIRQAEAIGHSGIISYPPNKMPKAMHCELDRYHRRGGNILLLNVISNMSSKELEKEYQDIPQLNIDDFYGGQLAARHLIAQGCECFYFSSEVSAYRERIEGFCSELTRNGIEVNQLKELETIPKKTGIFAKHDFRAYQLIMELNKKDMAIGKDVLLCGFDDQVASIHYKPSLTTVHQPTRREGQLAVEKLIRMIYGGKENSELLKPRLMFRETTGGIRPDPADKSKEIIIE